MEISAFRTAILAMTAPRARLLVVYLALLATIIGLCVTVVALPVLKLDDPETATAAAGATSDDANEMKKQQAVDVNYMLPTGNLLNIVVDRAQDAGASSGAGRVKVSLATNSSGAGLIDGIDKLQKQVQDSIGQRDHEHDLIDSRVHGNKIFGRRTDNPDISESTNSTRPPVKISIGAA